MTAKTSSPTRAAHSKRISKFCRRLPLRGAEKLAAPSPEGYVALVRRLGLDREYRAAMIRSIAGGRRGLFADPACIRALDGFFKREAAAK